MRVLTKYNIPFWMKLGVILPLVEIAILRSVININFFIGIEPMVLISPVVAMCLGLAKWEGTAALKIHRKPWLLFLHFLILGVFVFYICEVQSLNSSFKKVVWVFLAALVFLSGFFYTISISDFIERLKNEKQDCLPLFVIGASFLPHLLWNKYLWGSFQTYFYYVLFFVKQVFGFESFQVISNPSGPILNMPWGRLHVLSWCSGFEGVCVFFFFWGVILLLDGEKIPRFWKWVISFLGVSYMLTLNLIRILSIVYVGMNQVGHYTKKEVIRIQVEMFHSQFAWWVYLIGLFLFFSLFYVVLFFKKTSNPNKGSARTTQ
ncbi:MAG: hypothetical protein FJ112_01860 [Deltaproteobacteria bacterium]|nr:hypothetical protein [Deltaproteobacteria bacterium]